MRQRDGVNHNRNDHDDNNDDDELVVADTGDTVEASVIIPLTHRQIDSQPASQTNVEEYYRCTEKERKKRVASETDVFLRNDPETSQPLESTKTSFVVFQSV